MTVRSAKDVCKTNVKFRALVILNVWHHKPALMEYVH